MERTGKIGVNCYRKWFQEAAMKNLLGCLLLTFYCAASVQAEVGITRAASDWFYENHAYAAKILKDGPSEALLPVINMLGFIWQHRDGAMGAEVADSIALAFIHHPALMFAWFEEHPVQYEDWLRELRHVLLTAYSDDGSGNQAAELNELKEELLEALKDYEADSQASDLAGRLIFKLENTGVWTVD